jgi:hypothetical protein
MARKRIKDAPPKLGKRRVNRVSKLETVATAVHNARVAHMAISGEVLPLSQLIIVYDLEMELKMKRAQIVAYMRLADAITVKS